MPKHHNISFCPPVERKEFILCATWTQKSLIVTGIS